MARPSPRPLPLSASSLIVALVGVAGLASYAGTGATQRPVASLASTGGPGARTQFVLLGIDATPSDRRPLPPTGFAHILRAMNRDRPEGAPKNAFTLFISTGSFTFDPERPLQAEAARPFLGTLPRNQPVIPYARSVRSVRARAANVRELAEAGVEMGSHTVRHAHGLRWDDARWREEFADHRRILTQLGLPAPQGFRAPFLEHNPDMYRVMAEHGMRYDASRPGTRAWPTRHPETGTWLYTIPSVSLPGVPRALFFDDNLRTILIGQARSRELRGRDAEDFADRRYLRAALGEFHERYAGGRAPFLVSGHGNFRAANLRFLRRVCGLPDVRCATFREATDYLDAHPELAGAE